MKRNWSRILSLMLESAVIGLVAMAMMTNFLIIAQGVFSPFSVVQGNSMYPHIEDRDAVLAMPVDPEEIKSGDVVIFPDPEAEGAYVVHRVIALEEREGRLYAVTKGDANPVPDPEPVPVNRIHGKVRLIVPMGGAFLEFLRSPTGFMYCVILPLLVFVLYLLAQRYKERRGVGGSPLLLPLLKA